MRKTTLAIIILCFFTLSFSLVLAKVGFAQTSTTTTSVETILVDNNDLGISRPLILPGNPFYGFKTFWHRLRFALTFNPQRKAELKLKYASQKLTEAEELIKKGQGKKEIINKILDSYQKEFSEATGQIDKIKNKQEREKFIQKYLDHSVKQQLVMQRLAQQVPPEAFEKIQEKRQKHLERFAEVMKKIANKEEVKKIIDDTIKKITNKKPGSRIRVQEILDNLEENVSDEIKPKIEEIRRANIRRVIQKIEKMPYTQKKKILEKYLSETANPLNAIEIADQLEKTAPELKPLLKDIKEKPIKRFIKRKLKNLPVEKKEKILDKIINNRKKHLETLEKVQEKLQEITPEQSVAPNVLKKVIEMQKKKIEKIQEIKSLMKERKSEQKNKEATSTREVETNEEEHPHKIKRIRNIIKRIKNLQLMKKFKEYRRTKTDETGEVIKKQIKNEKPKPITPIWPKSKKIIK